MPEQEKLNVSSHSYMRPDPTFSPFISCKGSLSKQCAVKTLNSPVHVVCSLWAPYLEQRHCSLHIFYCLDLENLGNAFPLCVFNFGLAVHRIYVVLEQKKKIIVLFLRQDGLTLKPWSACNSCRPDWTGIKGVKGVYHHTSLNKNSELLNFETFPC